MADPTFEEALHALSQLAAEMERAGDKRRYGVNSAWHVLVDIRNGYSQKAAIRKVVPRG